LDAIETPFASDRLIPGVRLSISRTASVVELVRIPLLGQADVQTLEVHSEVETGISYDVTGAVAEFGFGARDDLHAQLEGAVMRVQDPVGCEVDLWVLECCDTSRLPRV